MQREHSCLDLRQARARGLDDDLPFDLVLEFSLPPVGGRHRTVQVDAGGQPFFDERERERPGSFVVRHGGQDKDEIGHLLYFAAR